MNAITLNQNRCFLSTTFCYPQFVNFLPLTHRVKNMMSDNPVVQIYSGKTTELKCVSSCSFIGYNVFYVSMETVTEL